MSKKECRNWPYSIYTLLNDIQIYKKQEGRMKVELWLFSNLFQQKTLSSQPTMSTKVSAPQDELLVYGWTREISKPYPFNIPIALISLFYSFCSNKFLWKIYRQQLDKIPNGKHIANTPISFIHNQSIKLVPKFFPNGFLKEHQGWDSHWNRTTQQKHEYSGDSFFSLELEKFPEDVVSFIIYYELKCKETNSFWKGVDIFKSTDHCAAWDDYTLSSKLAKQQSSLSLVYNVKLLHVEYKYKYHYLSYRDTAKEKPDYHIHSVMPKVCNIKWELSPSLIKEIDPLNKAKMCDEKKYFSPNFGRNNWCLWLRRNKKRSYYMEDKEKVKVQWNIGLLILKLPSKVGKVAVDVDIKVNDGERRWIETCIFTYDDQTGGTCKAKPIHECGMMSNLWIEKGGDLRMKFEGTIRIKNVFEENGTQFWNRKKKKYARIPAGKLGEYGILK